MEEMKGIRLELRTIVYKTDVKDVRGWNKPLNNHDV